MKIHHLVSTLIALVVMTHSAYLLANPSIDSAQLQAEQSLVKTLKSLVKCKNMNASEDGDLYCELSFRGLQLQFAGVNAKPGGTIYVTSLGKNQTLSSKGSHCIEIAFADEDLIGVIPAHVLFRDDGVITYNYSNGEAWAQCE